MMKIVRIVVYQVDLPLIEPYWLSGGRLKFEQLDSTLVRIDTDEGISGWGEGCPWGHTYLPAHGSGIRAAIDTLASALLSVDPRSIDHINRLMDVQLPGHGYAKSPIDIACWDIAGQAAGLPLWQMFGGHQADPVHVNSSISTGTPDQMIDNINKARAKGYRIHSAKIGGSDPGLDIERIEAIDVALLPGEVVTYDVNRAWTTGTALLVLNAVSAIDWVEQPCETLEQCAYVARNVRQPIVLDECLHDMDDHLRAWKLAACAALKIKPNRVGGLTRARRIRDLSIEFGWKMHIEDVGGSVLADTATLHLASSTPAEYRLGSWLCHDHLAADPMPAQGARNIDGVATPPSAPGIGVIPDTDRLGEPVAVYEV